MITRALKDAGSSFAAYEIEKVFKAGPSPMDRPADYVIRPDDISVISKAQAEKTFVGDTQNKFSLDGEWRIYSPKTDDSAEIDITGKVPGSIQYECFQAGVIPDPYIARNDDAAHKLSQRDWYLTREFDYDGEGNVELVFDGVCDRCDVELNGDRLGKHQGMFGGPVFNVTARLKKGKNILRVHLLPAIHFTQTVVFNCSDGWHYAKIWPLGIWNHVYLRYPETASLKTPFVTTLCSRKGVLKAVTEFIKTVPYKNASEYKARITVVPKNFDGNAMTFTVPALEKIAVEFAVPDFRLWWPNGFGEQNLYKMYIQAIDADGNVVSERSTSFGIRTLEMQAYPSGEREDMYNHTLVFNKKGVFMKGAGWCTIDALMRYDRASYDKTLARGKQQGLNFLRAWGGGLTETDEFYDLCDEYGICVYQEWPCCWDSQQHQPKEVLFETLRYNEERIRNHPSLAVYGGGNEGNGPMNDAVLNEMGRITYEYDGTRAFWRQDGGVGANGISHDHIHWGGETPEHYMSKYGFRNELNMHEYGQDATMNLNSIKKFSTPGELVEWPLDPQGTIAHHMQTFNGHNNWSPSPHGHDVDTCLYYAGLFLNPTNLAAMSVGSQMAQAMSKYPTIVNARIKWPNTTANIYYKLSDIYPGGSWATVDWYGAPKYTHYLCQDAQESLLCAGFLDRYNTYDKSCKDLDVPVYVLDDYDMLRKTPWKAVVRLFGKDLSVVAEKTFEGDALYGRSSMVGSFHVSEEQLGDSCSVLVYDLYAGGKFASRYYMPLNYERDQGCLFRFPKASLFYRKVRNANTDAEAQQILSGCFQKPEALRYERWGTGDSAVIVTNNSDAPSYGVHFTFTDSEKEAAFVCSDNFFILMPGESKVVYVSDLDAVSGFTSWNDEKTSDELTTVRYVSDLPVKGFSQIDGVSENCRSVTLSWNCTNMSDGVIGFNIYVDGTSLASVSANKVRSGEGFRYTVGALNESTSYEFRVTAVGSDLSEKFSSEPAVYTVMPDLEAPKMIHAKIVSLGKICISFDKAISPVSASCLSAYSVDGFAIVSAEVADDPKKIILSYLPATDDINMKQLLVSGLTDTTVNENIMEPARIKVIGTITQADFVNNNGVPEFKNCAYGMSDGANIHFTFRAPKENGFRAILSKNMKNTPGHFEFYIGPDGTLRIYSPKGDIPLEVSADPDRDIQVDVAVRKRFFEIYIDGKFKKHYYDVVDQREIAGDFAIGQLVGGGLDYDGVVKDIVIKTY